MIWYQTFSLSSLICIPGKTLILEAAIKTFSEIKKEKVLFIMALGDAFYYFSQIFNDIVFHRWWDRPWEQGWCVGYYIQVKITCQINA